VHHSELNDGVRGAWQCTCPRVGIVSRRLHGWELKYIDRFDAIESRSPAVRVLIGDIRAPLILSIHGALRPRTILEYSSAVQPYGWVHELS
jgi:hypothetical protein